ncbi:MAG: hypothetical protein EBQ80_00080 [Proteobacteria bacterium]|nr:hypothetical protein [Pseudomonadota bacterium]
MNSSARDFWNRHPTAYRAATDDPISPQEAGAAFAKCVESLAKRYMLPIALIARPHNFDAGHLFSLMQAVHLAETSKISWTWHDLVPTLAYHAGVTQKEAKARFTKHLPPLPHVADQDSYLQGLAFCRALQT